jgi:SAM-dependent methyltransferase
MNTTSIDHHNDALRTQLHGMWAAVAPGWAAHADFIDDRGAAVTEALLGATMPQPGERVLELACGPGGPGFAAAPLVGPDGDVVVSDVAAEMTSIAAVRARILGLDRVRTRDLDLEQIDEPDASFDVVLCREGLMLVADPARATAEIHRVLRPGGRVALTVWGPRNRNPWLGVVFDVVGARLGLTVPPPAMPHPFSLSDTRHLAALLAQGGLDDVTVDELATPYRAASIDEWWERTAALAGPLSMMLASLPDDDARELRDRAAEAISAYRTPTGLDIPGVSLLAHGRKSADA